MLIPVVSHIMYNPYGDECKSIFRVLSTIRHDLIVPLLIENLENASQSLTEPFKITACLSSLSASSRPFVENYPLQVIRILTKVVPQIDINDMDKSSDILNFISDLLDMIWLIDFSNPSIIAKVK